MNGKHKKVAIFEGTRMLCQSSERLQEAIAASRAGRRIYWEGRGAFTKGKREEEGQLSRALTTTCRRDLEYMFGYGYKGAESRLTAYELSVSDGPSPMTASVAKGSYAEDYCNRSNIKITAYL